MGFFWARTGLCYTGGEMHYLGFDIVEMERIQRALGRWGKRFLFRVYTDAELRFCRQRLPELAARFAAKEAVMKVLGTGNRGVAWREIEVLPNRRGAPQVQLYGRARERALNLGITDIAVSLSHCREYAAASALGETA